MLKWTKTGKLVKSGSRRASNFANSKSKSLALALIPTENQIFMACLDADLYEIEYMNGVYLLTYSRFLYEAATINFTFSFYAYFDYSDLE
jgi:hypothetical protein